MTLQASHVSLASAQNVCEGASGQVLPAVVPLYSGLPASELRTRLASSPTAAVPNLFGTRDRFRGRQTFHGQGEGDGSGNNASDGERQMKLHLLSCPLCTPCRAAQFLTGRRPVPGCGPGDGDPCPTGFAGTSFF